MFNPRTGSATLEVMADKKPKKPSGKHTKKRIGVNFSDEWHAVLRQLAARTKQPVIWYLIDLAKREADAAGITTPELPWEKPDPS